MYIPVHPWKSQDNVLGLFSRFSWKPSAVLSLKYHAKRWARSKTRSSRKIRKPRRISFPRFSTPSFPFCTMLKTENSEMKTSGCCFKPFYQTPSFSNSEFSILHYTKTANSELETSTERPGRKRGFLGYRGVYFSNFYKSVFSIFTYSEYRKLGSKKAEIFKHPCFRYSL